MKLNGGMWHLIFYLYILFFKHFIRSLILEHDLQSETSKYVHPAYGSPLKEGIRTKALKNTTMHNLLTYHVFF